jgi:hypothetical protein
MPDNNLTPKDKLDYAWKWFECHAGQRMVAFNYLLVIMGALSVAFYQAQKDKEYFYAFIVSCFGTLVAFIFLILDIRNKQLVQIGRDALIQIEGANTFSTQAKKEDDHCCLSHHDRKDGRFIQSHTLWLRVIEIFLLVLFLLASITPGMKVWEERCRTKTPSSKIEVTNALY